jgi:SAM-dependent methyltransferase
MQGIPPRPVGLKQLLDQNKVYDLVRFSTEADIFNFVHAPSSPEAVAMAIGSDVHFVTYLLIALCRFGFINMVGEGHGIKYVNSETSDLFLRRSSDLFVGDIVFNEASSYEKLRRYLKEGPPPDNIDKAYWTPDIMDRIATYAMMGWVQAAVEAVNLSGRRHMLDIGGGHGLYSIFFTKKYPGLKATVLDLPHVLPATAKYIARFQAEKEVDMVPGDYRKEVPRGQYDVVFVSNVVAYREDLLLLLKRAREALVPGGVVVARNAVFGIDEPGSALFSLEKYACTGRMWFTKADIAEALISSGFSHVETLFDGDGHTILTGVL